MRPSKNFKMAKSFKRLTRTLPFISEDQRHSFRHMMIEAQLVGDVKVTRDKSERK